MRHCSRALGHGGFAFAPASSGPLRRTPASLQPHWPGLARAPHGESRRFASSFFRVKAPEKGAHEHAFFVIGIDRNKFFGQDAAEEGLKLLERLVEQDPHYHLVFGLTNASLSQIQDTHHPNNRRLTPSRELENKVHGEFVPLVQAGIIDERPRTAVARDNSLRSNRTCWELLMRPREAVHAYWALWQWKKHVNAQGREFWLRHFPAAANAYFNESAEAIAIQAVDYVANRYRTGKSGSTVLFVNNDVFAPCVEHLERYLGGSPQEVVARVNDENLKRELQARADMIRTVMTAHPSPFAYLLFIYAGIPLFFFHFFCYATFYLFWNPTWKGFDERD